MQQLRLGAKPSIKIHVQAKKVEQRSARAIKVAVQLPDNCAEWEVFQSILRSLAKRAHINTSVAT